MITTLSYKTLSLVYYLKMQIKSCKILLVRLTVLLMLAHYLTGLLRFVQSDFEEDTTWLMDDLNSLQISLFRGNKTFLIRHFEDETRLLMSVLFGVTREWRRKIQKKRVEGLR